MARLDEARERLERAVARLETAMAQGGDRDALADELARVRRRCALLEERARDVSDRLDDTIGRVRELLEG